MIEAIIMGVKPRSGSRFLRYLLTCPARLLEEVSLLEEVTCQN